MILIDAGYLTARSRYAFKQLANSTGVSTGAVFGFLSTVRQILKNYPEEEVIVCLEGYAAWRSDYVPCYKQHREARQPEYFGSETQEQHRLEKEAIVTLVNCLPKVKVIAGVDAEADDLIAVMCLQYKDCIIFSNDHDMWQLAQFGAKITNKLDRGKFIFQEVPPEFAEIPPANLALYRAVKGDSSDEIPGVFRASTKVTQAIAKRCSSPHELFVRASEFITEFGKPAEVILSGIEQIKANYEVCKLPPNRSIISTVVKPNMFKAKWFINQLELESLRYLAET